MNTVDQYVKDIEKNVDEFKPEVKQEEVGWVTELSPVSDVMLLRFLKTDKGMRKI